MSSSRGTPWESALFGRARGQEIGARRGTTVARRIGHPFGRAFSHRCFPFGHYSVITWSLPGHYLVINGFPFGHYLIVSWSAPGRVAWGWPSGSRPTRAGRSRATATRARGPIRRRAGGTACSTARRRAPRRRHSPQPGWPTGRHGPPALCPRRAARRPAR